MTSQVRVLPEAQLGPAERLLGLVLNSSAHLWHNRPGLAQGETWRPRPRKKGAAAPGLPVEPGLFVPAAVRLYGQLLDIFKLNIDLIAHFASYALTETDWRDLKVACCALMLVQGRAGQPIMGDDGTVLFHDDDLRSIGEAMILFYKKGSPRMMSPKAILRVGELLESPQIAELNRKAGFGDANGKRPVLGRYERAVKRWLQVRENNPQLLEGLVKAGYKETLKRLCRKVGYKPASKAFFEALGWKQSQAEGGHRTIAIGEEMKLARRERFDGLDEAAICERIVAEKLSYKDVVGRLPRQVGLTPAIMITVLPSLSDRDLRILTPTLEDLGLLSVPEVKERWEKAVAQATDQRALHVARNVRSRELREKLEEAADNAARKAVTEATAEADVHVLFLIDKSGSMTNAIERSKEALSRIVAGFPIEKVHIASFDTVGTVLRPKAASRPAIAHMLSGISASGGTTHGAALRALRREGVVVPREAKTVAIIVGDEDGEPGAELAKAFGDFGYPPAAIALMLNVAQGCGRGTTVRTCAQQLKVPFAEIGIEQFEDPYQVPRVLRMLLEAPVLVGAVAGSVAQAHPWVDRVMATPLLQVA